MTAKPTLAIAPYDHRVDQFSILEYGLEIFVCATSLAPERNTGADRRRWRDAMRQARRDLPAALDLEIQARAREIFAAV
jgi:hypothetical protein